eukprot:PLAT13206.1.p2 GENE.PLAT13206.1~~PLAT13206.1.p2  ORF type:complete len:135 (+),score=61.47 PLAT13206.1:209-613(+)
MVSSWQVMAAVMPVPLVLIFFLTLPFPASVKRIFSLVLNKLLYWRFAPGLHIVRLMLGVSLALLANTSMDIRRLAAARPDGSKFDTLLDWRGRKWRAERNFWMAAVTLVLWWSLHHFHAAHKRIQQLEEEAKSR